MNNILFKEVPNEIVNLFIKNKNEYIHGREIARMLKANQMTVQNYLNSLEDSDILVKKNVGKSYNYKLKVDNLNLTETIVSSEIYELAKLKQSFQISQIINDIKSLTRQPMLIFGSYAKGYSNDESDLDILILDEKVDNVLINKIQTQYTVEINIITLSKKQFKLNLKKGNDFSKEVLRNHIICQDYEFFTNLWRKYYGKN